MSTLDCFSTTADKAYKNLKVLAVIPGAPNGMKMVFARRLVAAMQQCGADVSIYYLTTRRNLLRTPMLLVGLRRAISALKPDVVHVHYGSGTGAMVAWASKVPMVVTFRGSDLYEMLTGGWLRRNVLRQMTKYIMRKTSGAICVNQQMVSLLPVCHAPVAVIPTGVDVTVFYPQELGEVRLRLGWKLTDKVVLFNAGHDPRTKRLDLASQAIEAARKRIPALRFVVLDGRTPPDQVPLLMNAANCLLVTSDTEGSPTIVQEALACNLPVISVPVGDVPELIRNVRPGQLVDREPEDIASAIVSVIADGRRSDGEKVSGEVSTTKVAERTLAFLLLSSRRE